MTAIDEAAGDDESADDDVSRFEAFVSAVEPGLRAALVARYGPERGREAVAEALGYAWEHRARVYGMEFAVGYLYRVGQSRTRRLRLRTRPVFDIASGHEYDSIEPGLAVALAKLSPRQRVSVVVVHGYGWSLAETASLLGITKSSVQRHVERALARLRDEIGEVHE